MRAMVMAAGLGTRLRPVTWEIPKPMVPVANRPIVEHLLLLLRRHGMREVIANLHWFPETIKGPLGDGSRLGIDLSYAYEEELLGTAGGVRNVSDFLTGGEEETFVVLAGDALTDVDLGALVRAHEANDGVATLAVKKVDDVSQYGVIVTDDAGRVQGFQEKPDPAEALSDLSNCMIYAFSREVFDYFPEGDPIDFALDVFPAMLDNDVAFHVHEIDAYWNDVGSLPEYLQGNLDVVEGAVTLEEVGGELLAEGEAPTEATIAPDVERTGALLIGNGADVGAGAHLEGPLVIGPGAKVGEGARLTQSVLLPGTQVPSRTLLARAIAGSVEHLRPG